jgi:hypothetical protein
MAARVRALASDRVSVALFGVFLLMSAFYVWRATFAQALGLYGGQSSPYNQLADAFLHLRLWVVHVPQSALTGNPYNPAQRAPFLFNYPDYSLYGDHLYLTWGPVPALMLVPLHILGFEPSASVLTIPFSVIGLGFALATLRVIVGQLGGAPLWMCVLAGLTLACASPIPYILRFPLVYHEEILGAYCFAMAGVWCGVTAVAQRRASPKRLAIMSLCLGLAMGSRVTLGATALLLVPVYVALRSTHPRRRLALALGAPFGVCLLLLLAYNQARFGDPLQYGAIYQINGPSTYNARFGDISYLAPALWSYLLAPPRLYALFPFLNINYPQVSYPFAVPAHYLPLSEETGGLLAMVPIAVFLGALPWLWRRRPAALGTIAPYLLAMTLASAACMLFVSYEIYTSSERYETDYVTLLLLAALSAWLAVSRTSHGRGRRLVRVGGAALALWSCAAGMAISFEEIEKSPGLWRALVDVGSPVSTVIAGVAGHPILAEVYTPNKPRRADEYANLGTEAIGFWLTASDRADVTIVSPDSREDAIVANTAAGPALQSTGEGAPEVLVEGPGRSMHTYRLPSTGGQARIPVHLERGINQIVLTTPSALATATATASPEPESQALVVFADLALASGWRSPTWGEAF